MEPEDYFELAAVIVFCFIFIQFMQFMNP